MSFRSEDRIEVRSNLKLTMRERGKIVDRREGHNIWLDLGGEYLARLISYDAGWTPFRNDRVRYMGLGIGGTRQLAPSVANTVPVVTTYPGTNTYNDTTPSVTKLERPVKITGGSAAWPPGNVGDVWLGQIVAPPTFPTPKQVTFSRLFSQVELSFYPFLSMPLSEIMLFTDAADPSRPDSTGIAYDTFDTLSKTDAFDLEIAWTIRFGS